MGPSIIWTTQKPGKAHAQSSHWTDSCSWWWGIMSSNTRVLATLRASNKGQQQQHRTVVHLQKHMDLAPEHAFSLFLPDGSWAATVEQSHNP